MTTARPCLLVAAGKADAPETWRGTFDGTTLLFTSSSAPGVLDSSGFMEHLFTTSFDPRERHVLLVLLNDDCERAHVAIVLARDSGVWTSLREGSHFDEEDVRAQVLYGVTAFLELHRSTADGVDAA